ncbi:acetyltransferase-like isoleucine patch superfamily enzyme [Labrenzia sp. EL_208]|nr:acetyltransferase-like isoleucine patch superfamily enzyme [Labrenzia sp. EL_132]MBG6233404.1 acetyltransferase-like isoleucine patch superfamily enzyme [Labrenzia sp. EL_208]
MNIGSNTRISRHAKLDRTNPKGIHIGMDSQITFGVVILTHDFINRKQVNTYVGDCVFLGGNSIILPGVRVGNHCIIGTGSVVTKDIPDNSIAVGNPARVIKTGIATGEYGILINDETDEKLPSESQLYEQFD